MPFHHRGQQQFGKLFCLHEGVEKVSCDFFFFSPPDIEKGAAICVVHGFCSLKVSHGEGGACIHKWLQKKPQKTLSPCREGHRCLLSKAGRWKLHDNFGLLLCKSKSTAFQVRGTGEVTTGHLAVSKFGEAAV